jgi:hypothetical protein
MRPEEVNWTQDPRDTRGWYESFYQRANHPVKPRAFWIRYTIFRPSGRTLSPEPKRAVGELWAVYFDGETGRHVVAKEEFPLVECDFSRDGFAVRVGMSTLDSAGLQGNAGVIGWDLSVTGGGPPLFLLPPRLYKEGFPRAKSLVGVPLAAYDGMLTVDGEGVDVAGWLGSQNHNWGSRHTDSYAFGQVAGFDNAPGSFLEVITARAKVGPLWTPRLTLLVLRHDGKEHALTSLRQGFRARGNFDATSWHFKSRNDSVTVEGRITAPANAFVDLTYANPPGGAKQCRNTKIGACEVTLTDRATGRSEMLETRHRALFEILT